MDARLFRTWRYLPTKQYEYDEYVFGLLGSEAKQLEEEGKKFPGERVFEDEKVLQLQQSCLRDSVKEWEGG